MISSHPQVEVGKWNRRRLALRLVPLILAAGILSLAAGCGKREAAAPAATPQVASQPTEMPAPVVQPASAPQPAPGAPNLVQPDGQVDTAELQRCVIRWIVAHHRKPANFEEFAATAGVAMPPPPAGKKYGLTKEMRIVLLNR